MNRFALYMCAYCSQLPHTDSFWVCCTPVIFSCHSPDNGRWSIGSIHTLFFGYMHAFWVVSVHMHAFWVVSACLYTTEPLQKLREAIFHHVKFHKASGPNGMKILKWGLDIPWPVLTYICILTYFGENKCILHLGMSYFFFQFLKVVLLKPKQLQRDCCYKLSQ